MFQSQECVSSIAYNVMNCLCTRISDQSAPAYITIGNGGNLEGLVTEMTLPQSSYSAYHEASFDQSILDIKNRIHAYFCWHRSQNGYAVEADSIFLCGWLLNRYFNPLENTSIAAV
ncbi:purple acid phosphatase 1-like [Tripterygium wilfordii]|uniref:purple acid phosphatase 1-like n=1 Tax=Tripterygium wilfordii TaxID=458696 RepID=UPI0018F809D6|nr:purple acid phosphatase 1-like [Tripterygium wilfordii]